jgi:arginine repressor
MYSVKSKNKLSQKKSNSNLVHLLEITNSFVHFTSLKKLKGKALVTKALLINKVPYNVDVLKYFSLILSDDTCFMI